MAGVWDYSTLCSKEEFTRFLRLLNFFQSFLPDAALLLYSVDEPDEEKGSLFGEKSNKILLTNPKGSPQCCHSSASVPVCLSSLKYRLHRDPHWSVLMQQGVHFHSGDVKDQNTQDFTKNTIFMPQFWPGDVKMACRLCQTCQNGF